MSARFALYSFMKFILARKLRMTQIFTEEGRVFAGTVLKAGPVTVTQVKSSETDGYSSVQVGFDNQKLERLSKPMRGHLKGKAFKVLKEFRVENPDDYSVGMEITTDDFSEGDKVRVSGTMKGRGFAGTVKRHGFKICRATHGNTNRRARGSLGAGSSPSRVFPGLKMAGQYGNTAKTIRGVQVVAVDTEKDLIYVRGAIPGKTGGVVYVKKNVIKG